MDKEWMRKRLPEEPPKDLIRWTRKHFHDELGPEFLVFHAERVPVAPDIQEIKEYNSLRPRRYEWAADCSCTACGESFYTQKVPGADAIRMAEGEDGTPYTMEPGSDNDIDLLNEGIYEESVDGEELLCPCCYSKVQLIHSRRLRGGRTKRIMVQTVQNIEGYTAVFYWMVVRRIDELGIDYVDADPMDAYVLTENGSLIRYTHVQRNSFGNYGNLLSWRLTTRCKDSYDMLYPDWGSINNKKSGGVLYEMCPDLEGTTGEKTGLTEYIKGDGFGLVQYLKFWRQHRNIENLVKSGQAGLVVGIFRKASRYCYSIKVEMDKYIDLKESKPHRMLRMSKAEFRRLREQCVALKVDTLDDFRRYQRAGGQMSMLTFMEIAPDFGARGLNAAILVMQDTPGTDLDKIARYMAKQQMPMRDVQYLVDTRRMAQQAFGGRQLTSEELWPRNLAGAHERLDRVLADQRRMADQKKREAYNQKFGEVIAKYGCLQWTDGELCIILPKSSQELHDEGEILRHCVGGYSSRHISGSDTIFFVRHYRRPERSYYTLDIRMNSGQPQEVQLHGYGNERHGIHKERSHSIPKKVRDFVDRWKREILIPWWIHQVNSEKKEKTA